MIDCRKRDSEAAYIAVQYNEATKHWVLTSATYAAHTTETTYNLGVCTQKPSGACYSLSFPSHYGAFPRIYVSEGKHASYAAKRECEEGGTVGSDTCAHVDATTRLEVNYLRNVGSIFHKMLDCVGAQNTAHPEYAGHYQECYWTGTKFRGWFSPLDGGDVSDPYGAKLVAHGFGP